MDENYLYAAVRYIENNPVQAGLVLKPEDYPWSSAWARVHQQTNDLLSDYFLTQEIEDWSEFLSSKDEEDPAIELLESRLSTGRPLVAPELLDRLQEVSGLCLTKRRPGPKPKALN